MFDSGANRQKHLMRGSGFVGSGEVDVEMVGAEGGFVFGLDVEV